MRWVIGDHYKMSGYRRKDRCFQLTMVYIVILEKAVSSRERNKGMKYAYIDPPTDADATEGICNNYAQKSVPEPVMSDTTMSEIVCGKCQLVPEKTEEDSAGEEVGERVRNSSDGAKQCVTEDLGAISRNEGGIIQTGLFNAVMKRAVSGDVLLLNNWGECCGRGLNCRERRNTGVGSF